MHDPPKVFFIGDVALDEYYRADYFPKLKEKIIVQTLPTQMGGMIANAACVYASYSGQAKFFTALNEGAISQKLIQGLQELGLDTQHMVWDNTLPDAKTLIIIAEDEHTVFIPTLNLKHMEIATATYEALQSAEYIYSNFCEIAPLHYQEQTCLDILKKLKAKGCAFWCDLDVADISDKELPLLTLVDTLFVNELGYENLSKLLASPPEEKLFNLGVKRLIITLANKGCKVYEQGEASFHVEGIPVPVVDVTGAGDTFCSSFLYAWTMTQDLYLAARFANFAATRAVTILGPRAGASGVAAVLDFANKNGAKAGEFRTLL